MQIADKLKGASGYRREEHFSRINVTNGRGVTVIGDGNVVNSEFTELSRALQEMERAVTESPAVFNEANLNAIADIGALQSQLAKPKPDRNIIATLWTGVEKTVTVAGFVELVLKARQLIETFIAGAG